MNTPDKWVVVSLGEGLYKVLAGWRGGYLDGDSWRLNSGIDRVSEDEDFYYFYGYSGSCYKCHKKGYGLTSLTRGILSKIEKAGKEAGKEIKMMSEDTQFLHDLV